MSLCISIAVVSYENQAEAPLRRIYLGNVLLGVSFIWHTLPLTSIPENAKTVLIIVQVGLLITYFMTEYKTETLFIVAAMWLIPYDNYLLIDRLDLHILILFYALFWGIHEMFMVKYFGVKLPLEDTIIISLVMFRIIGPGLVIYFALANFYKAYMAYIEIQKANPKAPPPDVEMNNEILNEIDEFLNSPSPEPPKVEVKAPEVKTVQPPLVVSKPVIGQYPVQPKNSRPRRSYTDAFFQDLAKGKPVHVSQPVDQGNKVIDLKESTTQAPEPRSAFRQAFLGNNN